MRVHAQDPTAYCAQISAEMNVSHWVDLIPESAVKLDADMTASAATPDDSVLLHESSSPSGYEAMLDAAAAALPAIEAYTRDFVLDEQAPPPQTSVEESSILADLVLIGNRADAASLSPAAMERARASISEPDLGPRPSLSRPPSPAPLSPRPQDASFCLSTVVPTSPAPITPEPAPQYPSDAPSLETPTTRNNEPLDEETKTETPLSTEESAREEVIKRKESDSGMKLPSPKRQRTETPVRAAPKDKRMSASARDMAASRVKSMKKLATPFRSPLVAQSRNVAAASPSPQTPSSSTFKKPAAVTVSRLVKETTDAAVTSPFRPPVPKAPAAGQPTILTVQTLERRLQLLKRAIKIKGDGGDTELETLALKWKNAARAASWDLWELVKNGTGAGAAADQPGQWNDNNNWGWGGDDDKKQQSGSDGTWDDRRCSEAESTGEHDVDVDMESEGDAPAPEKADPSVGTMLTELGIAPAVLGWKEDEGDFSET